MGNLVSALLQSGNALRAYSRALSATQANINNASAAGYARQVPQMVTTPPDPLTGIGEGVRFAGFRDTRNLAAEEGVHSQASLEQRYQALAEGLQRIEPLVTSDGGPGISGSLHQLFQAYSAWNLASDDGAARNGVVGAAQNLASTFQATGEHLRAMSVDADRQLAVITGQVNALGAELADLNRQARAAGGPDSDVEARIYSRLEQLSNLTDFTFSRNSDGSFSILIGGQAPLVLGETLHPISFQRNAPQPSAPFPQGPPDAQILAADGRDITALLQSGQGGGLLDLRNRILPSLIGNGSQQGDLNLLANSLADRVNQIHGTPIFAYNSSNMTDVVNSLAVAPGLTAASLNSAGGVPLQLANLADSSNPADQVNGFRYTAFFAMLSQRVGLEHAAVADRLDTHKALLVQAKNLREQSSGVSLEEEAVTLLQFQNSFQAAAKMVSVLNDLMDSTLNMVR